MPDFKCGVCGKTSHGYPNDGLPLVDAPVCDDCNWDYVIPLRLDPYAISLGTIVSIKYLQKNANLARADILEMIGHTEEELEPMEKLYQKLKGKGGLGNG